jgi:hypothetical protein
LLETRATTNKLNCVPVLVSFDIIPASRPLGEVEMRVSSVQIKVVLLLSLSVAAKTSAQSAQGAVSVVTVMAPLPIKGVPFTATWQQSIWDHGKLTSQTTPWRVARASDGSTYSAALTQEPPEVDIDDLPNNRMITLFPRNHTYRLSTPQNGKFHPLSLEEATKMLEQRQERDAQGIELPSLRMTSLGVKQEDGMTLYGQETEWHIGRQMISEEWISSDLGVKARLKGTSPTEERVSLTVLRDVRRVEPDSTLFQIPEGYTEIK